MIWLICTILLLLLAAFISRNISLWYRHKTIILEILKQAEKPLTVAEILSLDDSLMPLTSNAVLDELVSKGVVRRNYFSGQYYDNGKSKPCYRLWNPMTDR